MKRRWPLRLTQLSPALVLALLLGVWFLVPLELRSVAASNPAYEAAIAAGEAERPDRTVMILRMLSLSESGGASEAGDSELMRAAQALARAMREESVAVVDTHGRALAADLPPDHEAFDSIAEHERRTGGETIALAYTANPHPPVHFSYVADEAVLTPEERTSLDSDAIIESIRRSGRNVTKGATLGIDVTDLGAAMGDSDGDRTRVYTSQCFGGHFYEIYLLAPAYPTGVVELPDMMTWESIDDPEVTDDLERAASRAKGAIIVVGPIDLEPIVLRATDALARYAHELATPSYAGPWGMYDPNEPRRLPPGLFQELGGAAWHSSALVPVFHGPEETSPLSAVRLIGVYKSHPQIPDYWERVGRTPVRIAQVWLALNFVLVLGALGALLLASLIASPVSFLYERRRAEEIEVERERARVQQQARRRVLDRLTRLSTEVDEVAARTVGKSSREVADVAADIEATVAALREILGDANGCKEKADA